MAVAHVQGTGIQSVGSVASLAKAFTSNLTAGNLVVVGGVSYSKVLTATSATDSRSHTYTRDASETGAATGQADVYSTPNVTAGACTVTLTPSSSSYLSIVMAEVSGAATSSHLDVAATGTGTSTGPVTGNLVTTQADYIFAVMTVSGGTSITETYTLVFEDEDWSDMPISGQYRIPGSSGTYTMAWTLGSSLLWACAAGAYKPAAAGTRAGRPGLIIPLLPPDAALKRALAF